MRTSQFRFQVLVTAAVGLCVVTPTQPFAGAQQVGGAEVNPRYDAAGQLLLPDDYRRWVVVGTSVGLSYAEAARGMQMFGTTLMEPTAHEHYVRTGAFREGTMLALILQGIGTNALPSRQGQFASDVHLVEMAVKDTGRVPERWAYYNFRGPMAGGLRTTAAPEPKPRCYACHVEHAARDNVFTQFYGLLNDAGSAAASTGVQR